MKIHKLWIDKYKIFNDFTIDFTSAGNTSVIIGKNSSGKSYLFEALIEIFSLLKLKNESSLSYKIEYEILNKVVKLECIKNEKPSIILVADAGGIYQKYTLSKLIKENLLPKSIFVYYSGMSQRMEYHFDKHQRIFYNNLIKGIDSSIRSLFYARDVHSQFVLLSFFSHLDDQTRNFLKDYFNIEEMISALFVFKEPDWNKNRSNRVVYGEDGFWDARGVVAKFMEKLDKFSLAPIRAQEDIRENFNNTNSEDAIYFYLRNMDSLQELANLYEDDLHFFKELESTYISDLIHEVRIKIRKTDGNEFTFSSLSEGEKQLLTVIGLLIFNKDEESLFLLDEPDTHLNPAWKHEYIDLIHKVVDQSGTSQIIISTHDPIIISGLLKNDVRILEYNIQTKKVNSIIPDVDPRGLGISTLLTSEFYGLETALDMYTYKKILTKRKLLSKDVLTEDENAKLREIVEELDKLGFKNETEDPLYDRFLTAYEKVKVGNYKSSYSVEEVRKMEMAADKIMNEILNED